MRKVIYYTIIKSRVSFFYLKGVERVQLIEPFKPSELLLNRTRLVETIQREIPQDREIVFSQTYTISKAKHPKFLQQLQSIQDLLNYKLLR